MSTLAPGFETGDWMPAGKFAVSDLGHRADDRAVVGHRLAHAETALQEQSAAQPRVDAKVEAVPMLKLLPEIRRALHHVQRSDDSVRIVEPANRLAGVRQSKAVASVRRHLHRELREVVRAERLVVDDVEVAADAAEISEVGGHTRRDLLLDAG